MTGSGGSGDYSSPKKGRCTIKNRTLFTGDNPCVLGARSDECIDLICFDCRSSLAITMTPHRTKAVGATFKDTWTLSEIDEGRLARSRTSTTASTRCFR